MAEKVLVKGNEAVAEAAILAGCRYFFGYPITPQTEISAYMAKRMPKIGGVFLQAESEVSAANMVYGAAGAGAGVEPISMVLIPKKGNDSEGVRVLDLSKGNETNKALSDLGLIVSDLVKSYMGSNSTEEYDESEYIEPEFTTKVEIEDDE